MAFMTNHLKNKGGPFKTYCLIYFHILGIHRNQPYGNINCALLEFGEKLKKKNWGFIGLIISKNTFRTNFSYIYIQCLE